MRSLPDFPAFFDALWNRDPFPWQRMLAERLVEDAWPKALDLPTAAGKTACIDIAVYALAAQAYKPVWERTAPRRIWFVVDRRIVVDEAFERAETIAVKLRDANDGPLRVVADLLRQVSGTNRPLATARLRGGMLRDDGWARLPSQPAVITSTVDQLGSRLLFRGYGRSSLTAPIFAGLAAHDSVILLDEAHLSVPFLETLRAVERYRGPDWAEEPIRTPFAFAILSATPPADIPSYERFPGSMSEEALDHPELRRRMSVAKLAELVEVKHRQGGKEDLLVTEAVRRAQRFALEDGRQRVAVVVNRVRTAQDIAKVLWETVGDSAHVVLLTGRLRPLDRDRLLERWRPVLRAGAIKQLDKPVILVATQCIEVGADFSFDALVTEAASLDALRQRFGRLARLGEFDSAPAVLLIRQRDARENNEDPIYGTAMAKCWDLLKTFAETRQGDSDQPLLVDFGIASFDAQLADIDELDQYLALTSHAPILLPAHLDLLCQTALEPAVQPDIQLYLHGTNRGVLEARVVWRADLDSHNTTNWAETVALCPPNSLEALSVPLHRLRWWLADVESVDDSADVEGMPAPEEEHAQGRIRPVLLWHGRERSHTCVRAYDLRPNDLVVIPASYGMEGLGQSINGYDQIDIWESSHVASGWPAALRLHRAVLAPWLSCPPLAELIALAEMPDVDHDELQIVIEDVLAYRSETDEEPPVLPDWLIHLLRESYKGKMETHPTGGLVLFAPPDKNKVEREQDLFADDDDLLSAVGQPVSLRVHSASVERAVERLSGHCLPEHFREPLMSAAYWHDVGKLDERFQFLLHQGDELSAITGEPLAKSKEIPVSPARRRWLREASGLPRNFRHEMLSLQLAERYAPLPQDEKMAELILHCVASHHGYARPFAPLSPDAEPSPVRGQHDGVDIDVSGTTRASWPTPHGVASGIPGRFWRLNRRYGWWGLAYLEAILRLGDWYGSRWMLDDAEAWRPRSRENILPVAKPATDKERALVLTGIDGTNPLGFLTALGVLVVLHHSGHRDVRLAWRRGITWQPVLNGLPTNEPAELVTIVADGLQGTEVSDELEQRRKETENEFNKAKKAANDKKGEIRQRRLRGKERQDANKAELEPLQEMASMLEAEWRVALRQAVPRPELALGKHIDCSADEYRDYASGLLTDARCEDREVLDLLAAFASDACLHENDEKRKKGVVAATPFCFITGSGHQYFLDFVRQLLQHVEPLRVQSALFEPWVYTDAGLSMRWDPAETRRYALMERDPGPIGSLTVWMANLLAYRALVLFPAAPERSGLTTVGWSTLNDEQSFTWPFWTHPCGPDTIRSLLLLSELYSQSSVRTNLRARGIVGVFRSRRVKIGSGANFKINFSPACEV
jgi:CRISPR-associated endonuclease/helicase Cas3